MVYRRRLYCPIPAQRPFDEPGGRRVRGVEAPSRVGLDRQRQVVDAFLSALRDGDVEGIMGVLDPDVTVRIDETAAGPGAPREIRGAKTWAKGAVAFTQFAHAVQMMLLDGSLGLVLAPGGRLSRALKFAIADGKIVNAEIIADPARLADLDLAVLE